MKNYKHFIVFSGIIENLTEFRPEMCSEVAKQGFLQWILKRLKVHYKHKPFYS